MAIENIHKFPEEEQSETVPKKTNKLRRKSQNSDFFSSWLERGSREPYDDNKETDDEDESSDNSEKPKGFYKRFRKLWHGFFAQLSEAEPLKLDGDHNQASFLQSKPENQPTNLEQNGQARVNEAPRQTSNDAGWREDQPILPNASLGNEYLAESDQSNETKLPNKTQNPSPIPANSGGEGDPPPPPTSENAFRWQPESNHQAGTEVQNLNVNETTPQHSHRPDWGPALVVGMYEGHLSRKRDRRIRRDIGKINNKLKEPANQINSMPSEHTSKVEAFNTLPPKIIKETVVSNPEARSEQAKHKYELEPNVAELKEPKNFKEPAAQSESVVSPEVIFREVTKAAEKNVPLEAIFERRHEVKDQPKEDFAMNPADYYGSSPRSSNFSTKHPDSQVSPPLKSAPKSILIDERAFQSSLAKGGVIGLLLLIVIAIALLIF